MSITYSVCPMVGKDITNSLKWRLSFSIAQINFDASVATAVFNSLARVVLEAADLSDHIQRIVLS